MFSDPVELRSEYSDPAVLNYQPQSYNEPVIPSAQQQSYSEEIEPNCQQKLPEGVRRRSRQQRPQQETLIPHQHQIYSDGVPQNIEHIRCPDPCVMENQQRIYSEQIKKLSQQQGYRIVPPENQQQYPVPVNPTCQYARSYNPEVLNSQPYSVSNCQQCGHSVPSAPYAQQQACNEPTTKSTNPKAQIKKKNQRRKDTSQAQDPASLLWQQHSSPQSQPQQNNQATNTQQYAVPPQMVRRVAQPAMIPELASQTVRPIHEQVPEYYQQYYNQHHENPHACRDQNHHHHPYKNP